MKRWSVGLFLLLGLVVVAASCAKATETLQCPNGESACGAICVDLQKNTESCGKCGTTCPSTQACVAGACTSECPTGNILCGGKDGGATACVNSRTDNGNCGSCGHTCSANEIC